MNRFFCLVAAAALVASSALAEPLATVGGKEISRADVEKLMAGKLAELESQRYQVMREGVDSLVADALLEKEAKQRGTTARELFEAEVVSKVSQPTDAEIQTLYDQYKDNLGGAPIEEVRDRLVEYLHQQKGAERQEEYLAELKKKYPTKVSLRPPTREVAIGSRVRGPANAPITIVEFSDYECPFCKRAEASVKQVLETYGDKVRFAYRDYPLEFHASARTASEAAHCANAQGKFWEYHDKLMASSDLQVSALKTAADEVGLNREKFDKCLDGGEFKSAIDDDIAAGSAAGVNGTPAFFINGRMLDGAQPFEAFQEVIDEELSWASQP
jgi:protein-disulfide isomerase